MASPNWRHHAAESPHAYHATTVAVLMVLLFGALLFFATYATTGGAGALPPHLGRPLAQLLAHTRGWSL